MMMSASEISQMSSLLTIQMLEQVLQQAKFKRMRKSHTTRKRKRHREHKVQTESLSRLMQARR